MRAAVGAGLSSLGLLWWWVLRAPFVGLADNGDWGRYSCPNGLYGRVQFSQLPATLARQPCPAFDYRSTFTGFLGLFAKADTAISHAAAAELSTLVRNIEDSKLNGNLLTALALDLIKSGQIDDGLARGEAGIAMLWAKGSTRSALRSGMFIGEWVFLAGNPRKAATIVRDLLLRGREPRFRIECGVLLANLASYHIALAEFDVARELILEAAEYLTRRTRFWYIALIQCAAAIEAETGDAIRAARARADDAAVGRYYVFGVGDQHILEDRHALEQADILEGPRDTQTTDPVARRTRELDAVEPDRATRRSVEARDQIKQHALARTVRPDDAKRLTR